MTSADRLAEAARSYLPARWHREDGEWYTETAQCVEVRAALAAYDADAERRQAEQAIIDAALTSPLYAGSEIWFAVRRLRELDQ